MPDYLPWIEGALSVGSGKQDNVLMTWCVWAIDCGEYHLALQIADYAVFHDLRLPEPFTRTLGTLLAEEFADQAKAAQAANKPFEVAYLEQVQRITADCDMPDESRARLLRELGLLLVEKHPEQALAYLERALGLDQKNWRERRHQETKKNNYQRLNVDVVLMPRLNRLTDLAF